MTLIARINDLAAGVRDKLNAMTPRLLPPGGTLGQALTKSSLDDYGARWASLPKPPETTIITRTGASWIPYNIPPDAIRLQITAIGGGGMGGAGFTRPAGSLGGGGAGGGGGAITTVDIIVAKLGGRTTLYASPELTTFVSLAENTVAQNIIARAAPGGNGGNGTASAGGSTPAGATPSSAAQQGVATLGMTNTTVGQVGGLGGGIAGAAGGNVTWGSTGSVVSGGGGGGGSTTTNARGGLVSGAGVFVQTVPAGTTDGGNGQPGLAYPDMLAWTGASGGGSNDTGMGGSGGQGAYGCGGGGGGAGTTGGSGGMGGTGVVIITAMF